MGFDCSTPLSLPTVFFVCVFFSFSAYVTTPVVLMQLKTRVFGI